MLERRDIVTLTVVITAAPADTMMVISHLMLMLYSLGFSNSGMSVKPPKSPRLLAMGMIEGLVDVVVSDAEDLSPLLGLGTLLRDVEGVEWILFISLDGTLGRTSSLGFVSMAHCGCLLRSVGDETRRDSRGYLKDLCAVSIRRPWV